MAGPVRYCPACYTANAWDVERCLQCGTSLASTDSFDERLAWALNHPDTATAMLAADLLARRGTRSAIDRLIEATRSSDPYRAAAAAGALASLDDDRARAAAQTLREHSSALVRRAVTPANHSPRSMPVGDHPAGQPNQRCAMRREGRRKGQRDPIVECEPPDKR